MVAYPFFSASQTDDTLAQILPEGTWRPRLRRLRCSNTMCPPPRPSNKVGSLMAKAMAGRGTGKTNTSWGLLWYRSEREYQSNPQLVFVLPVGRGYAPGIATEVRQVQLET